jgi:hypothetical protein
MRLDDAALDQLFRNARTHNAWLDKPVPDSLLVELHDLMKWGPTSANCWPLRVVFVKSPAAKARLVRRQRCADRGHRLSQQQPAGRRLHPRCAADAVVGLSVRDGDRPPVAGHRAANAASPTLRPTTVDGTRAVAVGCQGVPHQKTSPPRHQEHKGSPRTMGCKKDPIHPEGDGAFLDRILAPLGALGVLVVKQIHNFPEVA